jgi:transcription antitermination factor NusG
MEPIKGYWAVAQTVSNMEHVVRREIEKTNRGAFVPTYGRFWKVDGEHCAKEYPLIGGYVFFVTSPDANGDYDWSEVNDIHGVYRVLSGPDWEARRVREPEMARLVLGHLKGAHNKISEPKFTRYYNPQTAPKSKRVRRQRPRRSKQFRTKPDRVPPDMQSLPNQAIESVNGVELGTSLSAGL